MSKFLIVLVFIFPLLSFSSVDEMKKKMQALYGENKEITGSYENDLSVKCNNGVFLGKKTENVLSFKGIPYAKPPVGDLRWKDPVLAEDSDKVYEAYYFGKSPIQTEWETEPASYYPQGEDCLNLNIWVNKNDNSGNKAVIVFIHGGSYGWGGASNPLYDGHNFVENHSDIIFVTVDFRLGFLGFINLSSVEGGENYKSSTNLGLLDIICALQWIQKNIEKFGGDPNKVTLMGQSSGAGSISLLPIIEGTEGLFKRIIAESGSLSLTFSLEEASELTKRMLKASGKSKMEDLIALSEKEISKLNEEFDDYSNYAIRDGNILPLDLYEAYKNGKGKDIDMLLGTNKDEVRYWIKSMDYYTNYLSGKFIYIHGLPVLYENNLKTISDEDKDNVDEFMNLQNGRKIWKITEFYNEVLFRVPMNQQADYHSEAGGNTFVYQWRYPGENEVMGACHNIELSYVFNNLEETWITGNKINYELSDTVQEMWANFAKTGNPSTSDYKWDPYNTQTRKIMVLDEKIEMEENYKSEQKELIEPLLKYYINGNYAQMSYNVPQVYKIAAQLVAGTLILFGVLRGITSLL